MRKLRRWIVCLMVMALCGLVPGAAMADTLAEDQQLNAYYTLMTLALSGGDYEQALAYSENCIAMEGILQDEIRADIWLKRGYALMYLQRLEEALEALDTCLSISANMPDAMLLKMQILVSQGDAQAASVQADAYFAAYPDQPEVYSTLGEIFAAGSDFTNAAQAYTRYLDLDAEPDILAYQMRGQYLLQMGEYAQAVEDLTQAIDGYGEAAEARPYYLRAIAQMQLGANAEAIADLDVCVAYLEEQESLAAEGGQDAVEVDADLINSRYYRGIAGMQMGSYEAAIADFTTCIDTQVNEQYAQFWRGACYLDSGAYELAMEDFAACQAAEVEVDSCMYYTALCQMGLQAYEDAVEGFTECIEREIMVGQSLYNRGMCYIQLGRTEEGQADLERSLSQEAEVAETPLPEQAGVLEPAAD